MCYDLNSSREWLDANGSFEEGGPVMRTRMRIRSVVVAAMLAGWTHHPAAAQATLPAPGFHHLHLNSIDPEAAIAFYISQFPDSTKATWGGKPALKAKTNVLILFDKVVTPPPADAQATAV